MAGMPGSEKLTPLSLEPDHGLSQLGSLARSALAQYLRDPPAAPRLHLGLNTLPEPPLLMAARIRLAVPYDSWLRCGEDLLLFLEEAGSSLSCQQPSAASNFDQRTQLLQRLLRPDSVVLVWRARAIATTESNAGWVLAADLTAGRHPDLPDLDPAIARPALIAWAVDRAGLAIFAWALADAGEEDIFVGDEVLDPDDEIFRSLATILAAQYSWTAKTFGL